MRYKLLGKTGLYVSQICLGTMTFGGKGFWEVVGTQSTKEAEQLVNTSLDAGVNFIDTADAYSEGQSEEILGHVLGSISRPRDQLVIATKVRIRTGPGPNQVGLSRSHIFSSIDASLTRLGLDFIDLYQVHGVDVDTPIEETMCALNDIVRSGKVRYIGFCNLPAWYAMKAIGFARQHNFANFVSAQMYYSIAGRDIEREIVPLAEDQKLAIMPWSPLAGGLLSGKFDLENPGPQDARRAKFDFPPVNRERAKVVLRALRSVSDELGISVARTALAWLLTRPFITSVIIGAKTQEQLIDNLESINVNLSEQHIRQIEEASQLPSEYPGWMVPWQQRDRKPDVKLSDIYQTQRV
jgi:aryl-alcohol dehydrogenase-like predicted oxidoreductase